MRKNIIPMATLILVIGVYLMYPVDIPKRPVSVLAHRAGAIHIGAIGVFTPCMSDAGRSYTEMRRGAQRIT